MEVGFNRRRERVGRTSTAMEVGVEKERACGVDLAAVGEAAGAASRRMRRRSGRAVWTRRWSGRWSAMHAWRRSRSGCEGGGKMIVARVRI
jgi:hypothetical protein